MYSALYSGYNTLFYWTTGSGKTLVALTNTLPCDSCKFKFIYLIKTAAHAIGFVHILCCTRSWSRLPRWIVTSLPENHRSRMRFCANFANISWHIYMPVAVPHSWSMYVVQSWPHNQNRRGGITLHLSTCRHPATVCTGKINASSYSPLPQEQFSSLYILKVCQAWGISFLSLDGVEAQSIPQLVETMEPKPRVILCTISSISDPDIQKQIRRIPIRTICLDEAQVFCNENCFESINGFNILHPT